jgi:hypothetical protein
VASGLHKLLEGVCGDAKLFFLACASALNKFREIGYVSEVRVLKSSWGPCEPCGLSVEKFRDSVAISLDLRPVDIDTHTHREAACAWEYPLRERDERPSAFLVSFSAKLQGKKKMRM